MGLSERRVSAVVVVVLVLLLAVAPGGGASPPTLPVADGSRLLSNLSAPVLAPGDQGTISWTLIDPLPTPVSATLRVELYAFNAYPGNATSALPPVAPRLSWPGSGGGGTAVSAANLSLDPSTPETLQVSVDAPSDAPSGDYAARFSVMLLAPPNSTSFLFESRGFFSGPVWENATTGPGGGPTLNLSRLGVSGVVPETAILVRANPYPAYLWALVGGALVLAAAGGYVAWRPGPGSRSGARTPEDPNHAPSALGRSRTSDGD